MSKPNSNEETGNLVTDQIPIEEPSTTDESERTDAIAEEVAETELTEAGPTENPEEPIQTEDAKPAEKSELEKLMEKRTGYWQVKIGLDDLKWVKNSCKNGKFEFTGANEAYMLLTCHAGFSGAVTRIEQSENKEGPAIIQASAIEACALLLNKHTSTAFETAERMFRIAIALNAAIMEFKAIDEKITFLRNLEQAQAQSTEPQPVKDELPEPQGEPLTSQD